MPAVSFSPEALSKLLNELTAQRAELADLKEKMIEANKAKMDQIAKPATMSVAGKSETAIQNELLAIRLFKKAGFQNVVPHQNVKTFNRWMAEGRRPIEGSKSIRVANLRLFHVTQTREVTSAEIKANKKQQADAVARHEGKAKGKPGNVTQLNPQ
jgi:ribosomal protein L24